MNRFIQALGAILLALGAHAEEVQKSVDAAADGTVDVSNIAGLVEIRGWSRKEVSVNAELGSDVEELVVERDGKQVVIRVEVPRRGSRHIDSELVINVPEKSAIKVGTVSADITIQDVHGSLTLNTVSGDIEAEVFAADLDIETVSGDVEVQGDDKKVNARLNSVSGDVDAANLAGDISASSVSGDIHLVDGSFDRVRINTTNGNMVFHAALAGGGRFDAETINGEIDIRFQGKVSSRFEIETFNGSIRNCFGPKPVRTSKYTPGRELNFTEGSGDGWVTINTLNGDVDICNE